MSKSRRLTINANLILNIQEKNESKATSVVVSVWIAVLVMQQFKMWMINASLI